MPDASFSAEFLLLQRAVAGRYSLVRELGRGGMGIVFLARDVALDRLVAIKMLPPALAASAGFRERFVGEARLAASLAHPHIVPIHAVEASGEAVFFVMTYVDGETLGQRVRRHGPVPPAEAMRIVQEVAWALAHAHARGVVHRDIKPDNILIDHESGRVLVTDFGIAHAMARAGEPGEAPAGTPHYLSPEVARGEPWDGRADLYALGVTAWFAMTGRHPYEAPNLPALLVRQQEEDAPSLSTAVPGLPPRFADAVDRCLARRPHERWRSAEELAVQIDRHRAGAGDVPGPVRAFLRETLPAGNDIATGVAGVASAFVIFVVMQTIESTTTGIPIFNILLTVTMSALGVISGGLALFRFGSVGMAVRDLVEQGFDHAAARAGIERAEAEWADEAAATPRPARRRRAWLYGLTGTVKTSLALWLATYDGEPAWLSFAALVLAVPLATFTVRSVWTALSEGPGLWTRLLKGKLGRFLFRGAERVARRRAPARVTAAEPTAIALGAETDALFRALPPPAQSQLRDLPAILASLREEAERLRVAGRGVPSERLESVVAAMESMRLDLLQLRADLSSVPDITRHLEAARRVAERVDEALGERPAWPTPRPERVRNPA